MTSTHGISSETLPAQLDPSELRKLDGPKRLKRYKSYLREEQARIKALHLSGAGGLEVANALSLMVDDLVRAVYAANLPSEGSRIEVIANGGYGRGTLNPGSDIDLLFLCPVPAAKLSQADRNFINDLQMPLWDTGFELLPTTRNTAECIAEARKNPQTRTAILNTRLLAGSGELFQTLATQFRKECIEKDSEKFLQERAQDIIRRRKKFSNTVFLQEPNLKESPGGLRDYHNLLWITDALRDAPNLDDLVDEKLLSKAGVGELQRAFDFLHRVRNAVHYRDRHNDILTLRVQGEIVDELGYTQKTLLRRIEAFMRDYYYHTRSIHHQTRSVFEIFDIEREEQPDTGFLSKLPFLRKNSAEITELENFTIRNNRMSAKHPDVFSENPDRLIRVFLDCQKNHARPSPNLRKLIKNSWHLIDRPFRYRKENRKTFLEILQQKGKGAESLRQMHRCGVLGRYLPEFGALDCLVQHEFFHRYTADEHTLRTIEHLDALLKDDDPAQNIYRDIFIQHPDPIALYLALILHDTGRAENVREHIDGSALLAARLCKRLQITGGRRALISFLVDHHLTLWRFATKKDINDPDTIAEFANIMRDRHRLDALLLFTYADSRGTNEEAWSPWKQALILQLYRATREALLRKEQSGTLTEPQELTELRTELQTTLKEKYHGILAEQFEQLPKRYFRYRTKESLTSHIKALHQYFERRQKNPDSPFEAAARWIEHPKFGYSELIIATKDRPILLEKICCVLASLQINIHSAEVYTRTDDVALDLLRVSTDDNKAVSDPATQEAVLDALYRINQTDDYNPANYLKKKVNFLKTEVEQVVNFPTRAFVSNRFDPLYTVIELQAMDRLALLHDIFYTLNKHHLVTHHARICTEKGAALDSLYVMTKDRKKLENPDRIAALEKDLAEVIHG